MLLRVVGKPSYLLGRVGFPFEVLARLHLHNFCLGLETIEITLSSERGAFWRPVFSLPLGLKGASPNNQGDHLSDQCRGAWLAL